MIGSEDLKIARAAAESEMKLAPNSARALLGLVPLLIEEVQDCHATLDAILRLAPYEIAEAQRLAWNLLHPEDAKPRAYSGGRTVGERE